MNLNDKETIHKFGEIFMPYIQRGKDELLKTGNKFVHYTSAQNAINILDSQQLWLRNPSCMNDYMEISHGHKLLLDFFEIGSESRSRFIDVVDLLGEGLGEKVLTQFDHWWKEIRLDTFIASISVHLEEEDVHGRLSMWRAYGSDTAKAALVLNTVEDPILDLNVFLCPASYYEYKDLETELLQIIYSIEKNIDYLKQHKLDDVVGNIIMSLIFLAVTLKHPGFKEEQEWRLIYLPNMLKNDEMLTKNIETINGVPQIVYKLSLGNHEGKKTEGINISKLLNRIIIGPSDFPVTIFDAFTEKLNELGFDTNETGVITSKIPLRT